MGSGYRRFVILDRDGTINKERHYLSDPADVELLPNAANGLRRMRKMGLGLNVVTNQSGLARGLFDRQRLKAIHEQLRYCLRDEGVHLDGIYFCPHHPDDNCNCRKPRTGLIEQAVDEYNFDPSMGFFIGDKACDIELGKSCGATTILVRTGYGADEEKKTDLNPDFVADDLVDAAKIIARQLKLTLSAAPTVVLDDQGWQLERIEEHLNQSAQIKQAVARDCHGSIVRATELIASTIEAGRKILLCGNGGSAADCQHMAAEFTSRLSKNFERPPMAAIALTTDTSFITAYANDYGFEDIFARQVEALGRPGDLLLGISTSGNSANVISALATANNTGMNTVILCGQGGSLANMATVSISVPSENTAHIQEAHLAIEHLICDLTERIVFGEA